MAGLMHGFGRWLRGKVSSARWIFTELTGSEEQAIKAERIVGAGMAAAIAAELPTKPFCDDLVESCGRCLAARVKDRLQQFTFRVLPAPQVNAFALPGGFIYITQPLLSLLHWDPHCIAFVLGHEMGHVVRRHAKDRIMNSSLLSVLTVAFPAAGAAARRCKPWRTDFSRARIRRIRNWRPTPSGSSSPPRPALIPPPPSACSASSRRSPTRRRRWRAISHRIHRTSCASAAFVAW